MTSTTMHNYDLLDNPVWHALQTAHHAFALGTPKVQRYPVHTLQLLGCAIPEQADLNEIVPWTSVGEKFFMVGTLPSLPDNWAFLRQLDCIQMICDTPVPAASETALIPLTAADREDMLTLINLVQPGFFYKDTPLLGNYYGIRQEGQLVAVAGERMRMTGLTEVSAVCTHPSFTGKGFAQQLVAHIVNRNVAEGKAVFLHYLASNERARKVYELLGFRDRRAIPFIELIRNN